MRNKLAMTVLALFAAASLRADEKRDLTQLSLEQLMQVQVVYAASKQEQNPRNAPSSITIVTAAQIEEFGYRNLGDILRSVRGFYVTNDRNYSYVGVRGFGRPGDYNTRILLMIDGHRLNDNIYDSALIGNEFPLDVALIDRVEVVRGPSSSIYGTNAFFAVVNVITRRPNGGEATAEGGSFGTYRERLTAGHQWREGENALASVSFLDSRGQTFFFPEFDSPDTNFGVTRRTDFERSRSAFAAFSRGGLRVESLYSSRDKGIPTGSFGTVFNDRGNKTVDGSSWVDISWERPVRPDLRVQVRAYADSYWYDGSYVFDYPPIVVNQDRTRGQWSGTEVMLRSTRFSRQTLLAGGEFQDNFHQEQLNYDRDPYTSYLDERHSSHRWALYGQDELRFSERALLNLGLRHDWYGSGSHFSPRAALIVSPRSKTTLKVLYGEAFRAANQYEQFYATEVPLQLPNAQLNPETIRTYEVVAEHFFGKNFEMQTSAYMYTMDHLISLVTTPDGALQFQNADHINARGLESELSWKSERDLSMNLNYAWQRTRMENGARLTNSPVHLAKLRLSTPAVHRLSGGIEMQYLSRRLTLAGDSTSSALITNVTLLARRLARHLDASATLYNAFNVHYGDPGSEEHKEDVIQQDGRSFRVKLTWRF